MIMLYVFSENKHKKSSFYFKMKKPEITTVQGVLSLDLLILQENYAKVIMEQYLIHNGINK